MWRPKEDNLSIKPKFEVFVDASGRRGSDEPRTPSLSIIPRAATEVVVPKCEKDGSVRGERHGKHCEAEMWGEALIRRPLVNALEDTEGA